MSEPANSWRVAEASAGWRLASGDLPDVNVWLALTHTGHPFHAVAASYWQSVCDSGTRLWFCRTTMMALVRLLAQPAVMGPQAMSLPLALAVYRQWLTVPQVHVLPDPPGLEARLQTLVGELSAPLPTRLWTDACLAATADTAGLRMVTFNRDFERFGLSRLALLDRPV
jgi:toxin-antitoxin system PIN domain toxin